MKNLIKLLSVMVVSLTALTGCSDVSNEMEEGYNTFVENLATSVYTETMVSDDIVMTATHESSEEYNVLTEVQGSQEQLYCSAGNGNSLTIDGVNVKEMPEPQLKAETTSEVEVTSIEVDAETTNIEIDDTDEDESVERESLQEIELDTTISDSMCGDDYYTDNASQMLEYIDSYDIFAEDSDFEIEEDGDYYVATNGEVVLKIATNSKELILENEASFFSKYEIVLN